jgi:hypothetical protein
MPQWFMPALSVQSMFRKLTLTPPLHHDEEAGYRIIIRGWQAVNVRKAAGSRLTDVVSECQQWPKCTRRLSGRFLMPTSHPERPRRIGEWRHLAGPSANLDEIRPERASSPGTTIELPSSLWETAMKTEQTRAAWNKGKLVGQKPPLRPKDVWAIRIYLQNAHAVRDHPCSTLQSTANCVVVILSVCESVMSRMAIRSSRGRKSFSERHNAQSNLN